MPRWSLLPLLLGTACSGGGGSGKVPDGGPSDTGDPTTDTDDPVTTDPDPTDPPTDSGGTVADPEASCAATNHPMVFRCTVALPEAGPAAVVLTAAGAPTRSFASEHDDTRHTFLVWGLLPDTSYGWEAAGITGSITTGTVPAGLANLRVDVEGTLFGADAVLVYAKCGYFVVLDGEGRVLWWLQTDIYDSFVDGMRWLDDTRSVLAVTDSTMTRDTSEVLEVDITGAELLHLTDADFRLKLTHDVARWGRYTYLLGESSRIGGVEVFDGTTRLGQWLLTDDFSGNNLDQAHVNGVAVSEAGEVLLSAHYFSTLIALDGDPASPTFLQERWHAAGDPGGPPTLPNPDVVPADPPAFRHQHAPHRFGDELWIMDNESQRQARAVRLALDTTAGTMTELDSWSLGRICPNQGGALPIDGGVLATCANADILYAFRDGASDPDWTMTPSCGGPFPGGSSTRAYPIVFH